MIEFIINILRVVLVKQAVEIFLTRKDLDKKIFTFVYGIYYVVTSATYCIGGVSLVYEICNFIGILGITYCYDDTWKKRLWTGLTIFCIDLSCLLAAIFSFDGNPTRVNLYLKMAVSVLLFLISVTAINRISIPDDFRKTIFDKRQTLLLFVTPVTSIIVLFSVFYARLENDKVAVAVCICMLISNLSIFYLYQGMIKSYIHMWERDIYKQQTALYQNQLEIIMESQNRIRSLRHDMKNHILALQAVVKNGSKEEVQEYLQGMQEFMVNPAEYVMTGNENIDSLLNYKIGKAKEMLYAVETKINIPEKLNLNSFDLSVVLGNLLDNALEAAVQTEEKRMEIEMSAEKGVMFLHIRNSYNGKSLGNNGILQTTKADRQNHGMGMKNVQTIVEKYHGDMDVACDHGYFEVDVLLYMKEL